MVKELRKVDTVAETSAVASTTSKKSNPKSIDDTFVVHRNLQLLDSDLIPVQGADIDRDQLSNDQSPPFPSTTPYYRLSDDEKRSVQKLRDRLRDRLPPNYDSDFNLYRWIKSCDRTSRQCGNIDLAEKLLSNHLRFRKALKLDEMKIPDWDENPAFVKRYLPRGFLHYMPSNNRFLWWVDYSSIDMAGVMNTTTSTSFIIWHFWKYEHMLRLVNECEKRTNALSGVRMIMDVKDYDMNPFSLMLTTNGGMAYYAQLIHYEHYPELTSPVNIINVAKWLMLPYRLIRSLMPKDFNERIRVNDSNFRQALLEDLSAEELPIPLGGTNAHSRELETIKAEKIDPIDYEKRRRELYDQSDPSLDQTTLIQVAARKRKFIPIDCQVGSKLKWWFRTDADVYFGIFYAHENLTEKECLKKDPKDILEKMEMVHPYLRLLTKVLPERGEHICEYSGSYLMVFCNKASWIYRRNIQLKIQIDEKLYEKRRVLERAYSVN